MLKKNKRPVFLDLTHIRQPTTALISIAHRIAGIVLFLALPFAIYLLDLSLGSQQGYDRVQAILSHGSVKLALILILWALAHHVFAGMRILLIDVEIGVEREEARRTAWVIAIGSVVALVMMAGIVWW